MSNLRSLVCGGSYIDLPSAGHLKGRDGNRPGDIGIGAPLGVCRNSGTFSSNVVFWKLEREPDHKANDERVGELKSAQKGLCQSGESGGMTLTS